MKYNEGDLVTIKLSALDAHHLNKYGAMAKIPHCSNFVKHEPAPEYDVEVPK